jgi:hypothetical protein
MASKRLTTSQFANWPACYTATSLQSLNTWDDLPVSESQSSDDDTPIVAGNTYHLSRNRLHRCDLSEALAAMALNRAVLHFREDPDVKVVGWTAFIHFVI